MQHFPVVIIGAGPAGLTAAYDLVKQGVCPLVVEKSEQVGGIARTEIYKGYRFDIGGHRFYTKVEEVQALWQEVLGDEMIRVPRLSRIYYRGKFFNYPLEIANTLQQLGVLESLRILLSYLKIKAFPQPQEDTLEEWVTNRFGRRLFQTFFKTYTEKVWGIPCDKIQADWAAQRIKGLSLTTAVINALFKTHNTKTLIKEFDYPVLGPGLMWERFQVAVEDRGGEVRLDTGVVKLHHNGSRIEKVVLRQAGQSVEVVGDQFISSMPVTALIQRLDPLPPPAVLHAARSLKYRAFMIVSLIINRADLFPDNWIYVHSPDVKVGRIQNFKNWSAAMVPDPSKTCLGMEYFCSEGDDLWQMSDIELLDLATREIAALGLAQAPEVEDGVVLRQPKAYPVYDRDYREHLTVIQAYLTGFDNLQTVGRNGMHRYNNQDHSMLTGLLAARNVMSKNAMGKNGMGKQYDLWEVNTERSYYEEFTKEKWQTAPQPLVPSPSQSCP